MSVSVLCLSVSLSVWVYVSVCIYVCLYVSVCLYVCESGFMSGSIKGIMRGR